VKLTVITTNEQRHIQELIHLGFKPNISIVITNNPNSKTIELCKKENIPIAIVKEEDYTSREEYDLEIMHILDEKNPDLILLAGYRKLIKNKELLEKYDGKIVNIHNSFLPEFPGYKPHEQAFLSQTKESGFTFHLVDEFIDNGEILFQKKVDISLCESVQEVYDKLTLEACKSLKDFIEQFSQA
jgi:phosphoribosylglycinamide formyltransferase-1